MWNPKADATLLAFLVEPKQGRSTKEEDHVAVKDKKRPLAIKDQSANKEPKSEDIDPGASSSSESSSSSSPEDQLHGGGRPRMAISERPCHAESERQVWVGASPGQSALCSERVLAAGAQHVEQHRHSLDVVYEQDHVQVLSLEEAGAPRKTRKSRSQQTRCWARVYKSVCNLHCTSAVTRPRL